MNYRRRRNALTEVNYARSKLCPEAFWISAGTPGVAMGSACQPANTNVNTNANANSATINSNVSSANANSESTDRGPTINTREPDKYSAILTFSLETEGGDKAIGIPPLAVQVARSGEDRRVEFKLPDGSPLIYLDHNNRHYVVLPS